MRYATREVSTKRNGSEFKFEVEVPQYDSLDEFAQAAGGVDNALKFVNSAAATGSVNGARAAARNAKAETADEAVVNEARATAKGYTPTGGERGPGQKAKVAAFDEIMARVKRGEEVSQEELAALAGKFGA